MNQATPSPTQPTSDSQRLWARVRDHWSLIKVWQTMLLLLTGLAGFGSGRCPINNWPMTLGLAGSLLLAISGSTVLNMVFDRDIDARMARTSRRPLPARRLTYRHALIFGMILSAAGVGWAVMLLPWYGLVVLAGLFFDVVVYTLWLKRRTHFSIAIGGLAGGMPALAGRVLAIGGIDLVGVLLALAVLFWIPTHIMTYSIKHLLDYRRAGVPTFPGAYGERTTRIIVAGSALVAAGLMIAAAYLVGMKWGSLHVLLALSVGLFGLAAGSVLRPSEKLNFGLFKYASAYMLGAMLLVIAEGVARVT